MLRLYQTPSYEFCWKPESGTFGLETPGRTIQAVPSVEYSSGGKTRQISGAELVSGRISQETLHDVHGHGQSVHIHYLASAGLALSLRIHLYQTRPFVLMRISVTNVGSETVNIRRFILRSIPDGIRVTSTPRGFYTNGWNSLSPAGFEDKDEMIIAPDSVGRTVSNPTFTASRDLRLGRKGTHISEMVGAVVTEKEALIGGCISTADQFVQFLVDLSSEFTVFEIQSQADSSPLDVGASLLSEWLYLEWVPCPNDDPFAQYVHAVIRQMKLPTFQDNLLGWQWGENQLKKPSEADIFDNIASAALFSSELPVKRIILNIEHQSDTGDWNERNEERFPHDFGWISKRIKGSGFVPDISLFPLIVHPRSALNREHPDWLVRNDKNTPLVVNSQFGQVRCLDVTHPGAYEYLSNLVDGVVNKWVFEGIHLREMYVGALDGQRFNQRLTRAQVLRRAYKCIRDAAGPNIFITASHSPFGPAIGLVDVMQTSCTVATSWKPAPKGLRSKKTTERELPSVRNSLLNALNRAWMNKRLWVNDSVPIDLTKIRSQMTKNELLFQVTLLGITGSATSLIDDLADVASEDRSIFASVIPPLLDGVDAVNFFDSSMPELAVVQVARSWGRWQIVAVFNWGDEDIERDLPTSLNLDLQNDYHLVDFWEQRYFRVTSDAPWPVLHLDPHGVALLSLRPVMTDSAHIVATTFHISQGGEITEYQTGDCSIELVMSLGRTAKGSVWLALPSKPLQVEVNNNVLDSSVVRTVALGIYEITFLLRDSAIVNVSWRDDLADNAVE